MKTNPFIPVFLKKLVSLKTLNWWKCQILVTLFIAKWCIELSQSSYIFMRFTCILNSLTHSNILFFLIYSCLFNDLQILQLILAGNITLVDEVLNLGPKVFLSFIYYYKQLKESKATFFRQKYFNVLYLFYFDLDFDIAFG